MHARRPPPGARRRPDRPEAPGAPAAAPPGGRAPSTAGELSLTGTPELATSRRRPRGRARAGGARGRRRAASFATVPLLALALALLLAPPRASAQPAEGEELSATPGREEAEAGAEEEAEARPPPPLPPSSPPTSSSTPSPAAVDVAFPEAEALPFLRLFRRAADAAAEGAGDRDEDGMEAEIDQEFRMPDPTPPLTDLARRRKPNKPKDPAAVVAQGCPLELQLSGCCSPRCEPCEGERNQVNQVRVRRSRRRGVSAKTPTTD